MNKDLQRGDFVIVFCEELQAHIIGQIEEVNTRETRFKFILYKYSEAVPQVQYFHGSFELFRTSLSYTEKLSNVQQKVDVFKFKEFCLREHPTKEQPFYLTRQYYDVKQGKFEPEVEKLPSCLCERIINPDEDNLVLCDSCNEAFYHSKCIIESIKCNQCQGIIKFNTSNQDISAEIELQRNNSSKAFEMEQEIQQVNKDQSEPQQLVVMERRKSGVDTNKMKEIWTKMQQEKEQKMEEQRRKQQKQQLQNSQQKQPQQKALQTQKKDSQNNNNNAQKTYQNLSVQQNEKIVNLVNKYKKYNPIGNLVGIEKKRMEVREKFFEFIIYGLIEFEVYENELTEEEKKVLTQDIYEIARKFAVEIEQTIFNINNKSNKYQLNENYKQRCKMLFSNLKDSLNFSLRRKIITKTLKAQQLCTVQENELYNPQKQKEIEEQKQKLFNRDSINLNENMYILKTNKGEEIIDKTEEKEKENDNMDAEDNQKNSNQSSPTNDNIEEENNKSKSENLINNNQFQDIREAKGAHIDQSLVDSLLNLIGDKAKQRMQQRLQKDLPNAESQILIEQLNTL
ncbi:hypothetical protein IMG5_136810 [Ichthyophthirius multifiliis]|uniref:Uncharacterized protein n=1 Tax=Ichthyophthirius multifiliis TaxID=5932 RepID=G0QX01_ICHMU|nr:hypothetical protein IMG5_136810 [Ichthyophthirius multifiliis]EGR30249.1 hypothetical protein IMG5_136810 [Ichthyophthirius multifiliis]|eukprot:XP_004031845.1 hypothetical protein IMG5_136810 [Ichthyophthirius multifiliis]